MWFNGPYTEMFDDEMRRLARRINKNRNATVVHHETCPRCGAKLVNLYRRDSVWMCRRCWEKHDAEGTPIVTLGPGKLYAVDEDGTHHPLADVKEGWTPGMTEEEYKRIRSVCGFLRECVEGPKCHHSRNIPQGCSWGECNWLGCPMNKYAEE